MADDDSQLLERCRAGDHEAFRVLVDRYSRNAYGLARRITGNESDAEEVVQDALIKAWRSLDRFRGGSSFYTWLYRIVHNVAIDRVRKTSRVRSVDYDDTIAREEEVLGASDLLPQRSGGDPERVRQRRELADQLGKALEKLSEDHKTVIILREVQGLTYEEIARVVGCPKGTVMSRLHHARKRMSALLKPYVDSGATVEGSE